MSSTEQPGQALTEHFSIRELTRSHTAERLQLPNMPREECEFANLRALAERVLEPTRALIGAPLRVTSGFRCATLNRLIGGATQSQHMLGEAADFVPVGKDVEQMAFLLSVQPDLPFDQLIFETRLPTDGPAARWIHISHRRHGDNRREVLSISRSETGQQKLQGIHPSMKIIPDANLNVIRR